MIKTPSIMKLILYTLAFLFTNTLLLAQVGIGTTTPDATMDINGTVRVSSLPMAIIADDAYLNGISTSNKINKTVLGLNIFIDSTGLSISPVARQMGFREIFLPDYDSIPKISNLDLYLGTDEVNEIATFITISGYTENVRLGGLIGGYEGRRLTMYLTESRGFNFLEENISTDPQNRFITLQNSQIGVNGNGLVELVYDDDAGPDGLGRWLVLKLRI